MVQLKKLENIQDKNLDSTVKKSNNIKMCIPKIALVGNPNCGKTTLFNHLTGSSQYVGNWPGVTVELKEGRLKNFNVPINIIDLPGIYSLSPYSPEEIVTRNYIMDEIPDVIINIIDSTNLERSLYLTTQIAELECKMIIALNMSDILKKKGKSIDYKLLEKEIGVPVIPISASKAIGITELINKTYELLKCRNYKYPNLNIYSKNIEDKLLYISNEIKKHNKTSKISSHLRFNTVKFFESDPLVIAELNLPQEINQNLTSVIKSIKLPKNTDSEILIADQRYRYICNLCGKCIKHINKFKKYVSVTHRIDNLATGRFTAIPIFLFLMFGIFFITFGPFGTYLKIQAEQFITVGIGSATENTIKSLGASLWSQSLIMNAVIGGVGSVISFLPQMLILFTLLSLLEDSGYMARAVFIMDKILGKIGLSGKAFVPLVMGFGCSVPAILGTRILEDRKNRNLTIFLIPFMSCSAKMPVYLLIASTFFPSKQFLIISLLYLTGIITAILSAYLFKNSLFKVSNNSFVMELPEYKVPSLKNLRIHIWDRTKDFIERAGTVILGATIVIWFLQSFDFRLSFVTDSSQSILSIIGNIVAPIFTLSGFGNWKATVSLLTGIIAKESIVSSMSVLYPIGMESLTDALYRSFTPISAISFMVFVLLYTPCVAAISAMYKELKSLKLTIIFILYQFFTALFASALVFQFGTLINNLI